jgi:TetR/AcrR family transcriptional repressor of mexJK operon
MSRRPTPKEPARKPRLGRPKDADKRLAVMESAKQLFAVHGLQGTSMDAIARGAGVSKVTVYSYFEDKDSLFRESVAKACEASGPDRWQIQGGTLKQRLTRIAGDFFDLITSADAMSLYRLMASNPRRHRKLSLLFWEAGPETIMQRFAQLLESAETAGELKVGDRRAAASHFFFLVKAEHHMQLLIGVVDKVSPAKRRAHIDEVVAMFLRAYAR